MPRLAEIKVGIQLFVRCLTNSSRTMDEFEIFKARASGCEIQIEDSSEIFQRASPRESLRSEGLPEEIRRSSRRKSLRKNSRRLPEKENDGSLQVSLSIVKYYC